MKRLSGVNPNRAMTLIEILIVLLVITIAAAMILPITNRPSPGPSSSCLNNVRQLDLGFLMYANDYNGKFPMTVSTNLCGTMEFLEYNQTFPHYQKLPEYIRNTGVFVCPADETRHAADYKTLTDSNLSYFINADASVTNPTKSILVGDRNLVVNGQPVSHGTLTLTTNLDVTWANNLHHNRGVLGFTDGHVEFSYSTNLNPIIQRQGLTTARLSVP